MRLVIKEFSRPPYSDRAAESGFGTVLRSIELYALVRLHSSYMVQPSEKMSDFSLYIGL
jgi:hypothetical protein